MLDKNGHEVLVVPVEAIEEGSIETLERQHSAVATLAKKVRPSVCTLLVALRRTLTPALSLPMLLAISVQPLLIGYAYLSPSQ